MFKLCGATAIRARHVRKFIATMSCKATCVLLAKCMSCSFWMNWLLAAFEHNPKWRMHKERAYVLDCRRPGMRGREPCYRQVARDDWLHAAVPHYNWTVWAHRRRQSRAQRKHHLTHNFKGESISNNYWCNYHLLLHFVIQGSHNNPTSLRLKYAQTNKRYDSLQCLSTEKQNLKLVGDHRTM